ncbi:MAG: type II toxin-antitoxin system HicA family toxin [Leptospirales bacterium]
MPTSGKEMLKKYKIQGWQVLRQKGSHVVIGKESLRETIPMHDELSKGLECYLLKRLKA